MAVTVLYQRAPREIKSLCSLIRIIDASPDLANLFALAHAEDQQFEWLLLIKIVHPGRIFCKLAECAIWSLLGSGEYSSIPDR